MDDNLVSLLCSIPALFIAAMMLCLPGLLYLFIGGGMIAGIIRLFTGRSPGQVVDRTVVSNSFSTSQTGYNKPRTSLDESDYDGIVLPGPGSNSLYDPDEIYRSENYEEDDEEE